MSSSVWCSLNIPNLRRTRPAQDNETNPGFYVSAVQAFGKHCGKGEIARKEQYLLFPVFSTRLEIFLSFFIKFEIVVCKLFQVGTSCVKFVDWERVEINQLFFG